LLYKIIERCKQLKQIWLIRAIQQRYQFVLRGITPLLKEWEIVLEIYENDVDGDEHDIPEKNLTTIGVPSVESENEGNEFW
jgi:hypothetical protein